MDGKLVISEIENKRGEKQTRDIQYTAFILLHVSASEIVSQNAEDRSACMSQMHTVSLEKATNTYSLSCNVRSGQIRSFSKNFYL